MLSLFGLTYLCEKTFLVMNLIKSRARTRPTDSHLRDMLPINTTAFEPDLAFVLQSRAEYHRSHAGKSFVIYNKSELIFVKINICHKFRQVVSFHSRIHF